ncbi:lysozyme g-like [Gadus morhua]|uniref:Lysozyme g n=1 Tax=Gadus morhua TaxID=8049 RepID=A0A8C5FAH9_GADMO|nr:lysozyme g-like [Gadus morhua]XP_030229481.1 lysozyme g-like [Gadus morhua]
MSNMEYGNIMNVLTSGASSKTARAYGNGLTGGGVQASEKMASDDLDRMKSYKTIIGNVARKHDVDPALITAVASRESRGGAAISGTKGLGDNGNGYGLMQVDKRWHQPGGAWDSEAHVDQATKILVDFVPVVQKKFPSWSREKQLKGALAAYNMGEGVLDNADVDRITTGNDYSADVVARAQYFKRNGF